MRKPEAVNIALTMACALRCPHCYASSGAPWPDELDGAAWGRLFDEITRVDIHRVNIEGGEPLLVPELPQLLRRLEGRREVILFTSGVGVTDALAERLRDAGLRLVTVTLDGAAAATHGVTRGESFYEAIQGIERFAAAGLSVMVDTVLFAHNWHETDALVDLAQRLEVRQVAFEAFEPWGRGRGFKEALLTTEQWRRVVDAVVTRAEREKGAMEIELTVPLRTARELSLDDGSAGFMVEECEAGAAEIAVLPDGAVVPCSNLVNHRNLVAGNVNSNTLMEIWSGSPLLEKWRRREKGFACPLGLGGHVFYRNYVDRETLVREGTFDEASVPPRERWRRW